MVTVQNTPRRSPPERATPSKILAIWAKLREADGEQSEITLHTRRVHKIVSSFINTCPVEFDDLLTRAHGNWAEFRGFVNGHNLVWPKISHTPDILAVCQHWRHFISWMVQVEREEREIAEIKRRRAEINRRLGR